MKRELLRNGFTADPAHLLDQVAMEVAYAVFAPVHEGRQPCFGAIVTDRWSNYSESIPTALGKVCLGVDGERLLADGTHSFLVREQSGHCRLWLPKSPLQSEAALFSFRDQVLFTQRRCSPHDAPTTEDLVVIQRLADGSVTVLHWEGVTTTRHGHWSFRPYQYRHYVEEKLADRLGRMSKEMEETIRRLLTFCLHGLSPGGCGATIIVEVEGDAERLKSCVNVRKSERFEALKVVDRLHRPTIAHLLSQFDGAAILDEEGELKSVKAWLPSGGTESDTDGGSRHLSAKAVSRVIQSPVFTVSADGPVHVYQGGEAIASF